MSEIQQKVQENEPSPLLRHFAEITNPINTLISLAPPNNILQIQHISDKNH